MPSAAVLAVGDGGNEAAEAAAAVFIFSVGTKLRRGHAAAASSRHHVVWPRQPSSSAAATGMARDAEVAMARCGGAAVVAVGSMGFAGGRREAGGRWEVSARQFGVCARTAMLC